MAQATLSRRFSPAALQEARERAGLSRNQLGLQVGVTDRAIYFYERGLRDPRALMVARLAEATGLHPGELFR